MVRIQFDRFLQILEGFDRPLIGREPELGVLRETFARVAASH
jgi:hypothetical protein